jgi:hypothetical protein
VPDSGPMTPSTPGTYYLLAQYVGDAGNIGSASSCGSSVVTIQAPSPVATVVPENTAPGPASPVVPAENTSPGPASPPVLSDLGVNRRCVRSATLAAPRESSRGLSFGFTLSQDATVTYRILRRVRSPRWRFCPPLGGTMPISFKGVYSDSGQASGGSHDTSLAHAATAHRGTRMQVGRGGRHRSLAKLAAGRPLAPGTYLLRMTAVNLNGRSNTVEVKFWVIGPHR